MKKLLFLLPIVLFSLFSCSDDEDDAVPETETSYITAKVNGISKTYNTVMIQEFSENGEIYYFINATVDADENNLITLTYIENQTGSNLIEYCSIKDNGINYYTDSPYPTVLNSNLIINNDSKITGTFNGSLNKELTNISISITDGVINVFK